MHFSRPYNQTIPLPHPRVWRNWPADRRRWLGTNLEDLGEGLMRVIASCLVWMLLVPFVSAAALPGQDQNSAGQGGVVSSAQSVPAPQPETFPNSPGSARSQAAENNPQFTGQQPGSREQQTQEPVGTAAAGSVETTGVAASKPAGAAIAPAKQRRTRALLIKVGALVGASVAVGTVVALSSASPSRPPGAR
jgi:hypothetical protein